MKKYSLEWFGKVLLGIDKKKTEDVSDKPYKSAKLIGDTAILVLKNGTTLEKLNCSQWDWRRLLDCNTEEELINIISCGLKQPEKEEVIVKDWDILKQLHDFEVVGDVVKMKGIDRSLPVMMVNKFTQIVKNHQVSSDEFKALKNFWYWLCLNPFPDVIDNLYEFLRKGDFKITKDGMFLAYRRVCKVSENTELVEFISNSYVKIKSWKKSPKNFCVLDEDGTYSLGKITSEDDGRAISLGNLAELYENIDQMEENRYTDNHTKTFDIRIGKVVNIPRSECTHSNQDCGTGGLHFANKGFNYYTFGDTGILMLVNPMNVVGTGDVKGRTSEYLPLCTLPEEEERDILSENEFCALELQEYYAEEQLAELEEKVKNNYMAEAEKDIFNISTPSKDEVQTIIHNLKEIVKNKVHDIKE